MPPNSGSLTSSLFSIMKAENVRCALLRTVRRKRGGNRFDGSQCSASAFLRSAENAPSCGRKLRAAAFRALQQARSDAGEVRAAPSVWRQRGAQAQPCCRSVALAVVHWSGREQSLSRCHGSARCNFALRPCIYGGMRINIRESR